MRRWITLKDGQTFSHATIELFRDGAISGVVTNDRGEPMNEVHIETWLRSSNGRLEHRHGAITDATGAYRITAVPATTRQDFPETDFCRLKLSP